MRLRLRHPVLSRTVRRPHPMLEFNRLWRDLDRWASAPLPTARSARMPHRARVAHDEASGVWTLSAPLPGRTAEAVNVTIEAGVLVVSSEPPETDDAGFSAVHVERGSLSGRIRWTLPPDADLDSAQASLSDGWLQVEVSRKARPTPRTIPVLSR